jgi:hypothetical protein
MKYASEVIGLLGAHPGREFRMAQIIRHVTRARPLSEIERHTVRKGVERVLRSLCDSGQVEKSKEGPTSAYYSWCRSLRHGVSANCDVNCDNRPAQLRP